MNDNEGTMPQQIAHLEAMAARMRILLEPTAHEIHNTARLIRMLASPGESQYSSS
jgi:hypothetical protein